MKLFSLLFLSIRFLCPIGDFCLPAIFEEGSPLLATLVVFTHNFSSALPLLLRLQHKIIFYIDDLGLLNLYHFGNFETAARHFMALIPGCMFVYFLFYYSHAVPSYRPKPQEEAGH